MTCLTILINTVQSCCYEKEDLHTVKLELSEKAEYLTAADMKSEDLYCQLNYCKCRYVYRCFYFYSSIFMPNSLYNSIIFVPIS